LIADLLLSKKSFKIILKAKPVNINMIPKIPNILKPGIAKISSAIKTPPTKNKIISQLLTKPSRYKGSKNNVFATITTNSANPIPDD
jgi:hypothetical protein